MKRLTELYNYLSNGGDYYSIQFNEVFPDSLDIRLGIDEFPHDKVFLKEFFELTEEDFNYIFLPRSEVKTMEDFSNNLHDFINGITY